GSVFDLFDSQRRGLAPGAELDDVPVLQALARSNRLVGVVLAADFFDAGIPEGYRAALAAHGGGGVDLSPLCADSRSLHCRWPAPPSWGEGSLCGAPRRAPSDC